MNDEVMANALFQIRVNEAAIYLLARKLEVEPVALFDEATQALNDLIDRRGFDAE